MNKIKRLCTYLLIILCFTIKPDVLADRSFSDLGAKVQSARREMIEFMNGKRDREQEKRVHQSAEIVSTLLTVLRVPVGMEEEFEELMDIWRELRTTREQELIPSIIIGRDEHARDLITGIQRERIERIYELIALLEAADTAN